MLYNFTTNSKFILHNWVKYTHSKFFTILTIVSNLIRYLSQVNVCIRVVIFFNEEHVDSTLKLDLLSRHLMSMEHHLQCHLLNVIDTMVHKQACKLACTIILHNKYVYHKIFRENCYT